ncbi:Thermostable monoacylglycerol lipase [Aquicella siphonis]|uniref:Thermostable monoacylglycerol lipase n=1 Tax=Aquicella siphonis TaxID=254247 RepID=A0A5E4PIR4_9COXI|nr:alpha/beta fold hydrolase [Aquicella siphonis]VVC76241.1 Thermostable monoacylglycerol lipase [Aquicella siphonis]
MNTFGNLSETMSESEIIYPISDERLPFPEYIARSRAIIADRRPDLKSGGARSALILDANSPYEFYPAQPLSGSHKRLKYGVLLIHGLLDCPFSLRDIGTHLQTKGMLCRSILLPGHGTTPDDLLTISYHDWVKAVRYGVESLRQEVDQIFLAGYSTGASLSVYQALQDNQISGVILLAPAIRIKAPVSIVVAWHYLKKWLGYEPNPWLFKEEENDYAKYLSIAFNPVTQVASLTHVLKELGGRQPPVCPIFMAVSREDETISSHKAINFFFQPEKPPQ